ncbi:TNFAIP3-interacting protein 1-like isoform X2 [Ptychodera flava]
MLGDSEDKVKHLKLRVEQLTASSRTGSMDIPTIRQPSMTEDHSNQLSPKRENYRIDSQHISNQESTTRSVNGLNIDVVSDSSPSDVDAEEQHNSNAEGDTSVHSNQESVGSRSHISPLQSVHSEEFRSGSADLRDRLSTPAEQDPAVRRSLEQAPDPDHIESFPSITVKHLGEQMDRLLGTAEKSALTPHLARTVSQVLKLERDNNTKTILSRNLMLENAELKTKLNQVKEEYEELLNHQRMEIKVLKDRVRKFYEDEGEKYEIVEKAQVEKAMKVTPTDTRESKEDEILVTAAAKSTEAEMEKLKMRISQLEGQNKEILKVNQQWDAHYKGMKASMEDHIRKLEQQLQDKNSENFRLRSGHSASFDEQRQKDVDRMLLDARKRVEVEESARESAMEELQFEKQRSGTLNNRVGVLERQVTQLLQLKTGMESEIKRLNKALAEMPPQPRTRQPNQPPINTTDEMRSHIEALQAQVSVYKEDFENERRDRERLASIIDELKNDKDAMKAERDTYEQQAKWYEEDFRREQEDKERLQRMLNRRTVDNDYVFNIQAPARPIEKKVYPPRPAEYFHEPREFDAYYRQPDRYMATQQIPQPPPYYPPENPAQHRYNETQQGRLIRRGPSKEDPPIRYPKQGQNLARTDLEVDGMDEVDAVGAEALVLNGRSLKCPRCERDFQEPEALQTHVERCVA